MAFAILLLFALINLLFGLPSPVYSKDVLDCSCGFYDPVSGERYSDAIITYFNETQHLPSQDFQIDTYVHKVEKGWTSTYRTAASSDMIGFVNESFPFLGMFVDPPTKDHLVTGCK
jgi:hypothetical protein